MSKPLYIMNERREIETVTEVTVKDHAEFVKRLYLASDLCNPTYTPHNPIYDMPIEVRLRDLEWAVKQAIELLKYPEMLRANLKPDGLKDREFALGNWIVRPRFE